ncbi:MAG: dicarboxylate/amino acid:cation symporter, partial [Brevinema sp.]
GICAMFVGFATNTPLTIEQQFLTIITASLAAIGTAGVPGAGAIMLLFVFETIGLKMTEGSPVALAYAMILGVDAILDMGQTALNVGGDLVCTSVIAKSENELDESQWK